MRSALPERLASPPELAVIISTCDRAALLRRTLQSLAGQTLDRRRFEVIVADDGSKDATREVAAEFAGLLQLVYAFQRNSGLAAAKNHGAFMTQAPLLLFLDDDDVAAESLLEQHVRTHQRHPADHVAVLGYTGLEPAIADDPLMRFVTEVEYLLFAYPLLRDGDVRDFSFFWGGRTSCKRAFLMRHGVFNPVFTFGCEDIELGYRLSKHNLQVVYNAHAVTLMTRTISFDVFCRRLVRQGRSNAVFSRLHRDAAVVQRWSEVEGADEAWQALAPSYHAIVESAAHLDRMARLKGTLGFPLEAAEREALHRSYSAAFKASKLKGIHEGGVALDLTANRRSPVSTLSLPTVPMKSQAEWTAHTSATCDEQQARRRYERELVTVAPFVVQGYCRVCAAIVDFGVDDPDRFVVDGTPTPNWREQLACPRCGLNNHMRAAFAGVRDLLQPAVSAEILIAEQTTALYRSLAARYRHLTGFEYLGRARAPGSHDEEGIRHEDLTALTFRDGTFDCVLIFDVLEHVFDVMRALSECRRVMAPGSQIMFSVPFSFEAAANRARAIQTADGQIEHLLPPEYHGDPMNPAGCLAFHEFGWQLLDQVRDAGFESVLIHVYWSDALGHLGREQALFTARRAG
jgi:glycosyltransferase involved in cell wall biosynthesis/SAM-dependent methyltransferase